MKSLFLFTLLVLYSICSIAQKPVLDTSVFGKWPTVMPPAISNNGNYVIYTIRTQTKGTGTLVIQATHTDWKMEIPGVSPFSKKMITDDNQKVIFLKKRDSLGVVDLEHRTIEYISHVSSFRLFKQNDQQRLAYQLNTPDKELIVQDLLTGKQQSFKAVTEYLLNDNGTTLLLQMQEGVDSCSLNWINLVNGKMDIIWQGTHADNLVLDAQGEQLAFTVEDKTKNGINNSLWYYNIGNEKAIILVDNQSPGIDQGMKLGGISAFTKDGSRIFITLKEEDVSAPRSEEVKVDIWNYKDVILQSQQLQELGPRDYLAVINIKDHQIMRLQQEDDKIIDEGTTDDVICMFNYKGNMNEVNWNLAVKPTFYIVSVSKGERKAINMDVVTASPGGRYIIGINHESRDIYSYEVASGILHNITNPLRIPLIDNEYDEPFYKPGNLQVASLFANDTVVFFYDKYDIWEADLSGKQAPINITNGYGLKNKIVFRIAGDYSGRIIPNNEQLILSAFNRITKENGFYSAVINKKNNPRLLTMGPYVYDVPQYGELGGMAPVKARDVKSYVVMRSSTTQSPNYFYTTDFINFTPLSNIYPEKSYNWMTSELLTWKSLDGRSLQGVLYKPENFDPQKKYPVILNYYEKMSDNLNKYWQPAATHTLINIPWFVSHGYIVLTPDIYFTIGEPGQSAYNAVVSAAKYLARLPWIDSTKMSIQGHSWSGYETNYIVTHTHLFAAAIEGAGPSDFISNYGSVLGQGGESAQYFFEIHQSRIGPSLWQRPDLYIKNSPIFEADKVTTPLLILHNKADGLVPFAQGVELFTALRRLGKKVWMLQYDRSGHHVDGKDAVDYTIRITQFFDHYLKGAPAPKWMTVGVPAKFKGIDSGLELDLSGKKP